MASVAASRNGAFEVRFVEAVRRLVPFLTDSGGVTGEVLFGSKVHVSRMVIPDVFELRKIRLGQHLRLRIFRLEPLLLGRGEFGLRICILTTGAFIKPFGFPLRTFARRRP